MNGHTKGAMMAVLILAVSTFVPFCIFDDADADEAPDYTFYRYTINFYSTSTDAKYLVWDFGDGTVLDGRWEAYIEQQNSGVTLSAEILTGIETYKKLLSENGNSIYCPIHTYGDKGTYNYSITAYNPIGFVPQGGSAYDGITNTDETGYDAGLISNSTEPSVCGSKDTANYSLVIMGFPTITLVDGTATQKLVVENGAEYTAATEPATPIRDGFTFDGWYTDADCTVPYVWSDIVTSDITLYAGWSNGSSGPTSITITVDGAIMTVRNGRTVADLTIPIRDGFTFNGWYSDEGLQNKVSDDTLLTAGMTLYSKFTENVVPEEETSATSDIIPVIVCIIGLIGIVIGLRLHPIIMVLGIAIAIAGVADILGFIDIADIIGGLR